MNTNQCQSRAVVIVLMSSHVNLSAETKNLSADIATWLADNSDGAIKCRGRERNMNWQLNKCKIFVVVLCLANSHQRQLSVRRSTKTMNRPVAIRRCMRNANVDSIQQTLNRRGANNDIFPHFPSAIAVLTDRLSIFTAK